MRSLLKSIVLMSVLLVCAGVVYSHDVVSAQETSSGNAYKIGVVNRKQVFDSYDRQKQEFEKLKKEMEGMQAEIDTLQKEFEALETNYKANHETMPQAEREAMEEQITLKGMTYQTEFRKLQGIVDSRTRKLFDSLKGDIDVVVREIGASENFHLILDGDPDPQSGSTVLYFSSTIDITAKVIEKINAK